jgi:hypothetical protein
MDHTQSEIRLPLADSRSIRFNFEMISGTLCLRVTDLSSMSRTVTLRVFLVRTTRLNTHAAQLDLPRGRIANAVAITDLAGEPSR